MVGFTSDQWVIVALVFILGLLIGAFLTAGGRRKWKARYREESARREAIEHELRDDRARWETREREWRDQDSTRGDRIRDRDGDGVRDDADRRPDDDRRA
ncbi:hypothetical protein [Sphingomonas sp.]|uniref:hypothetical protein n=1 Tax=Sphingomonas sp. TaxID=28214 RepID=UPI0017FEA936|nr:hypothetical protein [Sphingomonas sp.]MBA3511034.1 hypothetical protein [Sphingomonas sp.]